MANRTFTVFLSVMPLFLMLYMLNDSFVNIFTGDKYSYKLDHRRKYLDAETITVNKKTNNSGVRVEGTTVTIKGKTRLGSSDADITHPNVSSEEYENDIKVDYLSKYDYFTIFTEVYTSDLKRYDSLYSNSSILPLLQKLRPNKKIYTTDRETLFMTMKTSESKSKLKKKTCQDPKYQTLKVDKSIADLAEVAAATGRGPTDETIWKPSSCNARQRVAVLVCYRNRPDMVGTFLRHMHHFLQQQNLEYRIFLIEQDFTSEFNRAMLFNIGAEVALATGHFDCLVPHDVDLLPEVSTNPYYCGSQPAHLSQALACKKWKVNPRNYFGGVTTITPSIFKAINGYSNMYFGWGSEDDDIKERIWGSRYNITQISPELGRYQCVTHQRSPRQNDRVKIMKTMKTRFKHEGFNSLKYNIMAYSENSLFTWIYAHIDKKIVRDPKLFQ